MYLDKAKKEEIFGQYGKSTTESQGPQHSSFTDDARW